MFPPHLPPPSCNIRQYNFWQRLKLMLLSVVFGFISGLTGAAVLLGWIWGSDYALGNWAVIRGGRASQPDALPAATAQEFMPRLAAVYRRREVIAGAATFRRSEYLGPALVVSADGWLAAHFGVPPRGAAGWQAVVGGKIRQVEQAVFDPISSLIFLRLAREGKKEDARPLPVTAFADSVSPPREVFGFRQESWVPAVITGRQTADFDGARLDSAPRSGYRVAVAWPPGTPVITDSGELVGLIGADGLVLPSEFLASLLPNLFERGTIRYPSLGVEGWFDSEAPIFQGGVSRSGFMVARVWSVKNPLRPGDLIEEINGGGATPERWTRALRGREVLVKVKRGSRELELTVPVVNYEP
ncbi:MAG: serine protease [Candidatus Magasanikbacteria bacterium]|nr:serine protease [Candidatus Magasanikbacteria bacterium]